jgi:hypothetical protein
MSSPQPAAPPPQPQRPAVAAQSLAEAARAAASAWSQPLDPAQHGRAISQLYSTLRDLGIAASALATYKTSGIRPGLEPTAFAQHVTASARWLLNAWQSLDGVLAAEGIGPAVNPAEPGATLCRAARQTLVAWRRPFGTAADREAIIRQFITAIEFLSAATLGLMAYPPRHRAIDLHAVDASLAGAIAYLEAAIQRPEEAPADGAGPARHPDEPR